MSSKKSLIRFALVMAFGSVLLSQGPAEAKKNRELLNRVLDKTIAEQQNVEKTYRDNPAAVRPEQAVKKTDEVGAGSIAIEVGDELPTGSGSDIKETRGERGLYREKDVATRLERELKEVDRSFREPRAAREARERRAREAREVRDTRGGRL